MLDEQSFDTRRHIDLFARTAAGNCSFVCGYERDRIQNGRLAFVQNSNEYAVPTTLSDRTNLYAEAFALSCVVFTPHRKAHDVFQRAEFVSEPGAANPGIRARRCSVKRSTEQSRCGVRITDRALTARLCLRPMRFPGWTCTGNSCSASELNVHYQESATELYLPWRSCFIRASSIWFGGGEAPHTTVNLGRRIRPLKRFRLTESWLQTGCTIGEFGVGTNDCAFGRSAAEPLNCWLRRW